MLGKLQCILSLLCGLIFYTLGLSPIQASTDELTTHLPASEVTQFIGPTYYTDTLWSIAVQHMPDAAVSPEQFMLAIVKYNPNAFIRGNVNGLLAGFVLRIPELAQIKAVSRYDALLEVQRHHLAWQADKSRTANEPTVSPYADTPFIDNFATINDSAFVEMEQMQRDMQLLKQQLTDIEKKYHEIVDTNTVHIDASEDASPNNTLLAKFAAIDVALIWAAFDTHAWQKHIRNNAQPIALGVMIILIIFAATYVVRRRKRCRQQAKSFQPDHAAAVRPHESQQRLKSYQDDAALQLSEEDINGSKIDLAVAYINMEDFDAARVLLDEVCREGSAQQRQEARRLLDDLKSD